MTEAVTQLQKGLDMLDRLADGPWRQRQELDLQMALRPALAATKGYSAPDVGETLARGRFLAEQLDRPDYLVPLLHGQWLFHNARAEYRLALSLARQMESIGETRNDVAAVLQSHLLQGFTLFFLGDVRTARFHFEQSHGLGDPARRADSALVEVHGDVARLGMLAMTLMYLGYIDLGRARMNEAVSEARSVGHADTLAFVLNWTCEAAWALRLPQEAYQSSEEILSLSSQHGFSFWLAEGSLYRGWSMAALGNAREGLAMLTNGLSMRRAAGAEISTPQALMLLDEAYARLGQPVEGLNCLAEAGQIIERTQERYNEAELHRLRGDLLNTTGDQAAAERDYHQALEVAKWQRAKLWELRAATSLARLWRDQGKRKEARDVLAPIYNWFTEGFDTPVLKDAKALLDQLAS
jgi:predicted ATPase